MANASKTPSRMRAPARMMSARPASRPGSLARAAMDRASTRCLTMAASSSAPRTAAFIVLTASPAAARAMVASARIVPDDPTATSKPWLSISLTNGARVERTKVRHELRAPGWSRSLGKKRVVSRTAPSLKLRDASTAPRCPMSNSVLPPPMSHSISRRSNTGSDCSTPRWISRASSIPDTTSISTPASSLARRTNSSLFSASRTALVATARTGASEMSAMRLRCRRASTPRWMDSGVSTFMSPPPDPRRTISFSRAITSKRAFPTTRATTRWKELVPTSMAASVVGATASSSDATGLHTVHDALAERRHPVEHGAHLVDAVAAFARTEAEEGDDALVEVTGRQGDLAIGIALLGERAPRPRTGEAVAIERAVLAGLGHSETTLHGVGPGVAHEHRDGEVADLVHPPAEGVLVVGDEVTLGAVPDAALVERGIGRPSRA